MAGSGVQDEIIPKTLITTVPAELPGQHHQAGGDQDPDDYFMVLIHGRRNDKRKAGGMQKESEKD